MKRDIIKIDEDRCSGCGQCIPNCPEGALQIIDGKARLVSDLACDGLGACIGHCPEDAITIEKREAEAYDEREVMQTIVKAGPNVIRAHLDHLREHGQKDYLAKAVAFLKERRLPVPDAPRAAQGHSCPGMRAVDLRKPGGTAGRAASASPGRQAPQADSPGAGSRSELQQWPVQLHLVNPRAPYFKNADLLIAADCVPFSYAGFHEDFLKGRMLVIFCPKLDDSNDIYVEKLAEMLRHNEIKSVTVVHMEVPCCFGTTQVVKEALARSGKRIAIGERTVSMGGSLV